MRTLEIIMLLERILFYFSAFFWIYQAAIILCSFVKEKEKPKLVDKNHKMMAVISARNEENVIGALIESLKKQDYPSDLLDIYVIADNCTDSTAEVARNAGAIVLERFDETKRSKGYALEWFFDYILREKKDEYDAFCVFDADNIVSKDFYTKMNDRLCRGEKIVQGYRDIKNAGDTWVTANYALFYWMMNRFFHYTRYKIGLSPLINGTGFMVSMDLVRENNGWHTETLTEDIEFSIKSIAKGYTIGWAHDAIVYDEQPLGFFQSWRQRMRWSVGHIQTFRCTIRSFFQKGGLTPAKIDAVIYLMGMPFLWLSVLLTVLNMLKFLFVPMGALIWFERVAKWNIIGALLLTLQALFVILIEKKDIKKVAKGVITYPIFLVSWTCINMLAYFNTNLEWKPIKHVRTVDIKEVEG
ncbi:MAG: glycosyltransferase family 2 protein [Clostridia bacterium]|nr:glycosyltransferase family 2 protein [Clostridia bacterium]